MTCIEKHMQFCDIFQLKTGLSSWWQATLIVMLCYVMLCNSSNFELQKTGLSWWQATLIGQNTERGFCCSAAAAACSIICTKTSFMV